MCTVLQYCLHGVWAMPFLGAGPVVHYSTGPVLGQYWASTGPVLGQYWASTCGSTIFGTVGSTVAVLILCTVGSTVAVLILVLWQY